MVERHEILEMMTALKRAGMATAFDELASDGLKRRHPVQRTIGALPRAGIADSQARSITYQISLAGLPPAKAIDDFEFVGTPINEPLVRDPAAGAFPDEQRNLVPVGGTGKSPLAVARTCIRDGARARSFNTVDPVNRLEAEARKGRQGRLTFAVGAGASEQGLHLAWLLTNLGFAHAATSRENMEHLAPFRHYR